MAKYESRARSEGFGGRASLSHYVKGDRTRTSGYGANPKASSFKPHSPFETGYGSGRHASPDNADQLYKSHSPGPLPDAKGTVATGHASKAAPKSHDGHLKSSADCCWAPGWREAVTSKLGKG